MNIKTQNAILNYSSLTNMTPVFHSHYSTFIMS